jgi:hypothetical protein
LSRFSVLFSFFIYFLPCGNFVGHAVAVCCCCRYPSLLLLPTASRGWHLGLRNGTPGTRTEHGVATIHGDHTVCPCLPALHTNFRARLIWLSGEQLHRLLILQRLRTCLSAVCQHREPSRCTVKPSRCATDYRASQFRARLK